MAQKRWIAYQPDAELLRASVRCTERMRALALPTSTATPTKKVAPPGRLMTRGAVQAAALRANGDHVAAMKVPVFRAKEHHRQARPPAVVGFMSDVSASMSWSTTAVGEATWLLARGAAHSGARVASVAFGVNVDPIVFPGEVPSTVLVRSATDYDHSPDRALAALDGALSLSTPTYRGAPTSRIVIIVSDLQWGSEREPFLHRARALMAAGVRFVVVGVPADRTMTSRPGVAVPADLPKDTLGALGMDLVIPAGIGDAGSPETAEAVQRLFGEVEPWRARYHRADLRAKIESMGRAAFAPTVQPAKPTSEEMRVMRTAGITSLPPTPMIFHEMLTGRPDVNGTRDAIVDEVLTILERSNERIRLG